MIAYLHRFPPLRIASIGCVAAVSLLLLAAMLGPAKAQSPPADAAAPQFQVTLEPGQVERFIASWPDFKALGDQLAQSHGVDPDANSPTTAFAAWAKAADAKAKIDAVVAKHGFASLEDWRRIADSVMLAYSYDAAELSDARLAEVLADIEANPQIPAAQKAEAAAQVREYFSAAKVLIPLPGNLRTIEPYLDELAAIAGGPPRDDGAAPPADQAPGGAGETQD
jgi:hypothetical protein